jgi:hypothetical protein
MQTPPTWQFTVEAAGGGSGSSEEQENVISIARIMVNMIKRLAVFFEILLIKAS